MTEAKTLSDLIPSLTGENLTSRRYAVAALLTLKANEEELGSIADDVYSLGDAESLEVISKKLKSDSLKIQAAELYARRARKKMKEEEDETNEKRKSLLNEEILSDSKKSYDLNPNPTDSKSNYVIGVYLLENTQTDKLEIAKKFEKVIESLKGKEEKSVDFLRSNLNLTVLYKDLAEQFKDDAAKYKEYFEQASKYLKETIIKYAAAGKDYRDYIAKATNEPEFDNAKIWLNKNKSSQDVKQ